MYECVKLILNTNDLLFFFSILLCIVVGICVFSFWLVIREVKRHYICFKNVIHLEKSTDKSYAEILSPRKYAVCVCASSIPFHWNGNVSSRLCIPFESQPSHFCFVWFIADVRSSSLLQFILCSSHLFSMCVCAFFVCFKTSLFVYAQRAREDLIHNQNATFFTLSLNDIFVWQIQLWLFQLIFQWNYTYFIVSLCLVLAVIWLLLCILSPRVCVRLSE